MAKLILENLTHYYKKYCALNNVSTTLNNGVVALIGPNGAGKSTLINIIVGLLKPTKGRVLFNNSDINELADGYYKYLGYCPQTPQFYNNFTALQFMKYMASLKKVEKQSTTILKLLELVNLIEQKDKKIATFSGGMKQRLGIAQALLNEPELLILDEPTAGLDPIERIRFRNLISEISRDKIVILATHIISDVENVANQILFLRNGELLFNKTSSELLTSMQNLVWNATDINGDELAKIMLTHTISNIKKVSEKTYNIKFIGQSDIPFKTNPAMPTLEDVFLLYFNKNLEPDALC